MNYFLFGKIGAGKTFVGRVLSREFGLPHYDADDDLTPVIRDAVRRHKPFTREMRLEVGEMLENRIHDLRARHKRFCIGQALFRNEQRHRLREIFPDMIWIWVDATPERIESRLRRRLDGLADLPFARVNNPHFEEPDFPHQLIVNEANAAAVARQFEVILEETHRPVARSVT